ncbi:MAG: hybrid sensor histidine kinase/response regulator [Deltaproteobacteria bacterium]|nr:hybrid sensor histidine kinase/response regulator [Deltaproteobacteria bacterium]
MEFDFIQNLDGPDLSKQHQGPLKILLIEDDDDDFILFRDFLQSIKGFDFQIDWISRFDDALAVLKNQIHDVCFLDYRLGHHIGLEILKTAKTEGWQIPIIFLTGKGEYSIDLLAMQEGAADYLVKDQLSPSLLERSIRYAMERSKAKMDLEAAYREMEQKVIERTAELADANNRLKKSSEKIQRFAYSVAHDLKSPAIAMYGLTKRLSDEYANQLDEKGKRYCDLVRGAAEQVAILVKNINLYMTAKENPISFEDVTLKEIFQIIREEFSLQLELRDISWREPEVGQVVRADKLALIRALRNLVDNALKYGGDGLSRISIHYHSQPDQHVIAVQDDGDGLREDDPQKIFGLFFREKQAGSMKPEGMGLGLAIVKEIAERHHGDVWAESGKKKGATIFMSISKNL